MAITSIKTGSSFTNLIKYNDFLAGNAAYQPTAYESIATVTVGSGGAANIEFTSIPSTYQHLQIRAIFRNSNATDTTYMRLNSDTGSNYAWHTLRGNGSSMTAAGSSSQTNMEIPFATYSGTTTSVFSGLVTDILDYKNTNKYKTIRNLGGADLNGSGRIDFVSGLWQSTNAITTIRLYPSSGNFAQYSKFGLFGIKGA